MVCQDNDLRDLGIAFGPRKKLLNYIKGSNQVNDYVITCYFITFSKYSRRSLWLVKACLFERQVFPCLFKTPYSRLCVLFSIL